MFYLITFLLGVLSSSNTSRLTLSSGSISDPKPTIDLDNNNCVVLTIPKGSSMFLDAFPDNCNQYKLSACIEDISILKSLDAIPSNELNSSGQIQIFPDDSLTVESPTNSPDSLTVSCTKKPVRLLYHYTKIGARGCELRQDATGTSIMCIELVRDAEYPLVYIVTSEIKMILSFGRANLLIQNGQITSSSGLEEQEDNFKETSIISASEYSTPMNSQDPIDSQDPYISEPEKSKNDTEYPKKNNSKPPGNKYVKISLILICSAGIFCTLLFIFRLIRNSDLESI